MIWLILPRLLIGAIFLMAGVAKLASKESVANSVDAYQLVPKPVSRALAPLLPAAEILLGLWLLSGIAIRPAGLTALTLFLVFALVQGQAVVRRLNLQCACFGLLYRERVCWRTVGRDLLFACVAGIVIAFGPQSRDLFTEIHGSDSLFGALGSAMTVIAAMAALLLGIASKGQSRVT